MMLMNVQFMIAVIEFGLMITALYLFRRNRLMLRKVETVLSDVRAATATLRSEQIRLDDLRVQLEGVVEVHNALKKPPEHPPQ